MFCFLRKQTLKNFDCCGCDEDQSSAYVTLVCVSPCIYCRKLSQPVQDPEKSLKAHHALTPTDNDKVIYKILDNGL